MVYQTVMLSRTSLPRKYNVFLAGTCGTTTWRTDTAIPFLSKFMCTSLIYNPQVDNWSPELVEIEADAKQNARYIIFVINRQTSGLASMLEATQLICTQPNRVVLFFEDFYSDNPIDARYMKDVNRARKYLRGIANEYQVKIHSNLQDVLDDVCNRLGLTMV